MQMSQLEMNERGKRKKRKPGVGVEEWGTDGEKIHEGNQIFTTILTASPSLFSFLSSSARKVAASQKNPQAIKYLSLFHVGYL